MAEQWAVVLGFSSGTGAAIARAVAREPGLHVFGVHRGHHPGLATAVMHDVSASGRRIHVRQADAGTLGGASEGVRELREIAGRHSIKLLVHSLASASVGRLTGGPRRLEATQIQRTFETMAHSFVYWAQELLERELLAPGAHIIGLSNPMDDLVVRNTPLIGACKAALGVYTRHLAHELGPLGHRVNLIKFGAVVTPAVQRTFGEDRLGVLRRALERNIPARRLCTVEEVARLVSLMASDALSWFNGAIIDFTGGESQGLLDGLLDALAEGQHG